ncbi:hypothetical protein FC96_GL002378 [Secundilactobacillus kimchicus JCM 15530]|uniref:Peptidase M10 metallopeptidase domain-containing protein n=1 Tax=Secundilactobacillus kimchicus JCM 15530 TaxID=1302272 RepID=A0A0R1HMC3_9LACO|nr:matrixin family metalloprotease [Secundilactobacillus kimchicus]KRK47654.1 hypothetical protein FC96_GL002378 [Secundilactobacillus kimchicus JCM 15530]
MRRMIIGLAAMSIGFIAMISQATAKATPAPSQTLISQPTETLQTTEMKLLKKYRINLAYQTAFDSQHQVWVIDKTATPAIATALTKAMAYWNDELGTAVFNAGSAGKATVTVKWTTQKAATDSGLAWWAPKTETLKVNKGTYQHELADITKYMKRHYRADETPTLSKKAAYAQITDSAAQQARTVEYARILTHELGHILGLGHSTNRSDLMYPGLGFGDLYDLDKVSADTIWQTPLTETDGARGQLAYRFEKLK